MPATNYGYSMNHETIFQVYGTKRKNSLETEDQNAKYELMSKRQCTDSRCLLVDDGDMDITPQQTTEQESIPPTCPPHSNMLQSPHSYMLQSPHSYMLQSQGNQLCNNQIEMTSKGQYTHQPCMSGDGDNMGSMEFTPDLITEQPCPLPSYISQQYCNGQLQQHCLKNDMIMDLNDEVYSNTVMNLSVCTDTEGDSGRITSMEGQGTANHQQCSQCQCNREGEGSPLSGSTGCLCRSSWNSMGDMQTYVSDYY